MATCCPGIQAKASQTDAWWQVSPTTIVLLAELLNSLCYQHSQRLDVKLPHMTSKAMWKLGLSSFVSLNRTSPVIFIGVIINNLYIRYVFNTFYPVHWCILNSILCWAKYRAPNHRVVLWIEIWGPRFRSWQGQIWFLHFWCLKNLKYWKSF